MTAADLFALTRELETLQQAFGARAARLHREELAKQPIEARLVYAACKRCLCGAGMAYDPASTEDCWDCSAILLGTADVNVKHEAKLPFVFWDIKEEDERATTRPQII